jgi:hypothetical protein
MFYSFKIISGSLFEMLISSWMEFNGSFTGSTFSAVWSVTLIAFGETVRLARASNSLITVSGGFEVAALNWDVLDLCSYWLSLSWERITDVWKEST